MSKKGKWVVEALTGDYDGEFEVSVIRSDNAMYGQSWGWFGADKILISHNGVTPVPIPRRVWEGLIQLAQAIADEMNDEADRRRKGTRPARTRAT